MKCPARPARPTVGVPGKSRLVEMNEFEEDVEEEEDDYDDDCKSGFNPGTGSKTGTDSAAANNANKAKNAVDKKGIGVAIGTASTKLTSAVKKPVICTDIALQAEYPESSANKQIACASSDIGVQPSINVQPTAAAHNAASKKFLSDTVMKQKASVEAVIGPLPADDPNYAVWLPPVNQSGDGKTALNDKFGY